MIIEKQRESAYVREEAYIDDHLKTSQLEILSRGCATVFDINFRHTCSPRTMKHCDKHQDLQVEAVLQRHKHGCLEMTAHQEVGVTCTHQVSLSSVNTY